MLVRRLKRTGRMPDRCRRRNAQPDLLSDVLFLGEATTVPIDPRAVQATVQKVHDFVTEYSAEGPRPAMLEFPNTEWASYLTPHSSFIYRRPETISALDAFHKKFETPNHLQKWSLSYIRKYEGEIIDLAYHGRSDEEIGLAVTRSMEELAEDPPESVALLPVAHLQLGDFKATFGNVTLRTADLDGPSGARTLLHRILDSSRDAEDVKVRLRTEGDERLKLLENRAAAYVRVKGDKEKAWENALRDVEPVLDFLQLAAAIFEHNAKEIKIGVGGDLLSPQPVRLLIAADETEVQHHQLLLWGFRLDFNDVVQRRMDDFGFGPIVDALKKLAAARSEFERYLLRSMHWIADAERQEREENKITGYVTAIDMFFSTKNGPITRDVTEGAAMILGRRLEWRKFVRDDMAKFYDVRSGVSHSGSAPIDEDTIIRLKTLVINFLAAMCPLSRRFQTLAQFRAWMADRRLGGEDESLADPDTT